MTPKKFRAEMNRIYTAATAVGMDSEDLAVAAKTNRHEVARWLGGYATPDTSAERAAVVSAVATLVEP